MEVGYDQRDAPVRVCKPNAGKAAFCTLVVIERRPTFDIE
jgi:hypothetical protein